MFHLLISVLILCLILGLILFLFRSIPILAPFAWVAYIVCVVVIVIFLIWLLQSFDAGEIMMPSPRRY
jgi:hypothetical protein